MPKNTDLTIKDEEDEIVEVDNDESDTEDTDDGGAMVKLKNEDDQRQKQAHFANIVDDIMNKDINIAETMIVSPGATYTIEEIVNHIVKIMDFKGNVFFDKSKPEGIMKKNSCNDIFKSNFPDFKFTSLEDGLSKNIEYFIQHYDYLRK